MASTTEEESRDKKRTNPVEGTIKRLDYFDCDQTGIPEVRMILFLILI